MESSVARYGNLISTGKARVHHPYEPGRHGIVIDPGDAAVPVDHVGFGVYGLHGETVRVETGPREHLFVPIEGQFSLKSAGIDFELSRTGGVFATQPTHSNTSSAYFPPDSSIEIQGDGEIIFYTAPAAARKPAAVRHREVRRSSTGAGPWRRDVAIVASPETSTSNLTVGETYSPPGNWSGTPLHVHDRDDPGGGQSDHEEIYYHVFRLQEREPFGPYALHMLFDGGSLGESWIVRDRSILAIPGAAHPVVSGPVSEHLYLFGLASRNGTPLLMFDMPEFSHLHVIEDILLQLEEERGQTPVRRSTLDSLLGPSSLSADQWRLMELVLAERGFVVT